MNGDRERWARIQELADQALDLEPADAAAFIERECGADVDLRAQVEDLLRWCERARTFMEQPAAEYAASLLLPGADAASRIGVYDIIAVAGRGGMGTVYIAERADEQFRQRVALKVIRPGFASDDALRRFRDERQILASMSHPAIARLFDGGMHDDGSPWFAMELIDGEPIDRFCTEHTLSVEEILQLFLHVCDAVQYAHAKLVVHRDLKPSNILVTPDGAVKLLDFGIARVLNDADAGAGLTRTGVRPMTPEYASPEQVSGADISIATDIYSLGVLLYRLLTGALPYPPPKLPGDVERSILTHEPERPSTIAMRAADGAAQLAADPRRRGRRLQGDLDTIVLRALRKAPDQRYGTVAQLADDVRRHLDGMPVLARPDRWSYRAQRFVRRHRIATAAAATIALVLLGATAVTSVQALRIRSQAADLARERDHAAAVSEFLIEVFEASDPDETGGATVTALELLDRAVARIDRQLANEPATRAMLLRVMARAYVNLGQYDRAEPLYLAALAIHEEAAAAEAATLLVDLGNLAHNRGRLDEAETHLLRAITLLRQHEGATLRIGDALDNLGMVRHRRLDLDSAERLYREGLALRRRRVPADSDGLASSLANLASLMKDRGEYVTADSLFVEAIAVQRSAGAPNDPALGTTLNNYGTLLAERGDNRRALAMLHDALAIRRTAYGDHHPFTLQSMNNVAALMERTGDLDAAEALYREALDGKIEAVGERHPSVAAGMNNLGLLLSNRGRLDEADVLLRRSLELRREIYAPGDPVIATAVHNLAALLEQRAQIDSAAILFRAALGMRREALGADNPLVAVSALSLGMLLLRNGDAAAAVDLLREAWAIHSGALGTAHPRAAQTEAALGAALSAHGRLEEAGTRLRHAWDVLSTSFGDSDARTLRVRGWLDEHDRRLFSDAARSATAPRSPRP